jgi:centractin
MDSKSLYSKTPIIIDIGTSSIKAGLSGQEKPSLIFPNYFGEMKYSKSVGSWKDDDKKHIIGNDCNKYFGVVKLKYPLSHGIFNNSEDISSIFEYIYSNLDMSITEIKEHPVLIAEPLLNPQENRRNIAKVLFDTYKIEQIFFASQPILSLFSTSSTSGAVLESGDGVTQSCIIYEGYTIPGSYKRINLGGKEVTEYLQYLLNKKGHELRNSDGFQITKKIKEELCEIYSPENENKLEPKNYTLPDDSILEIGDERRLAPEILFNPLIREYEYPGIQEILAESINKTNVDLKLQLYGSILLSGGNTNIKGMKERIYKEIKKLAPKKAKIRLHTPSNPENCCWIGGNIISSLEISKEMWISVKEYMEKGENILHTTTI